MSFLRNAFIVLTFAPAAALGCISDRDCPIAAHCERTPGQDSGFCTGGMLPESQFGHMTPDPMNRGSDSNADGCVTDADCGYTGQCRKGAGQVRGVCMGGIGGVITGGGMRIPGH